jgi:hypothetical protein
MKEFLVDVNSFKPIIKESKQGSDIFQVEGVMQRAGAKNQNGRIYKKEILEREVEKYMDEFVTNNNAYGELDHPESEVVSLQNASHIVKKLWWDGDDLKGLVEILDSPNGNIVKNIIKRGYTIGISSRGTGSVEQTNEGTLEVQPDFQLVCWDFVSNPSTHGAFMKPKSLSEARQATVAKYAKLHLIVNDILRV